MARWILSLMLVTGVSLQADQTLVEDAIMEVHAQHMEKAHSLFLEALTSTQPSEQPADPKDQMLYEEALSLYLNPENRTPKEVAEQIIETYDPVVTAHPTYTLLSLIVANAHANIGETDKFFSLFYRAFQAHPTHYLVDKTRAVLHLRLMERCRYPIEREKLRQKVITSLKEAVDKYPGDLSLYRMISSLGTAEEKEGVLKKALQHILASDIAIPRTDIFPYVRDASGMGEYDLAQGLIDRAHKWYRYSRSIKAAQKYLDQQRQDHG